MDAKNELTITSLFTPAAFAANANSNVLDTRQYEGNITLALNVGTATAGTSPTIDMRVMYSAESNGANAVNQNIAFTQVTAAGIQTINVDKRALGGRYIKLVGTIGGTNSPSYPIGVVAIGKNKSEP